jgi:hypothetical protein
MTFRAAQDAAYCNLQTTAGQGALPAKPLPAMRDRLKALDAERLHLLYGLTSQVTQGSRAAYQPRYGWNQDTVKADHADEWNLVCVRSTWC